MSDDHKLPTKTSPTDLAAGASRAVVERSEVAGFTIWHYLGEEIKRPIAGLALLIMDKLDKMPQGPKQISQAQTVLPPGSLVIAPESNSVEGLKAAAYAGMQHIRGRIGGFLEKRGHCSKEEADPQIERIMREAIAEAAEWRQAPEKMTSKLKIERAIDSAQHQFRDIIDAGLLAGGDSSPITGKKVGGRLAG